MHYPESPKVTLYQSRVELGTAQLWFLVLNPVEINVKKLDFLNFDFVKFLEFVNNILTINTCI